MRSPGAAWADLAVTVNDRGGILLRSGPMRIHEGFLNFGCPEFLTGHAEVCEWYDDSLERFQIEVNVVHAVIGSLFGYTGWFVAEWPACHPQDVPLEAKPVREERRE